MKFLLSLAVAAICAFSVQAQIQTIQMPTKSIPVATSAARAEFMNAKYWSKIGSQEDKEIGFVLFSRNLLPNPEGQIELWVKVLPNNTEKFIRHYNLSNEAAFVLQYATVDCAKNSLMLDRTAVYDANFNRLGDGTSALNPKSSRDRVKAGSIGSEIFQAVCVKLAA